MDEEMERIEIKTTRLDGQIRELLAAKKKDQAKAKIAGTFNNWYIEQR